MAQTANGQKIYDYFAGEVTMEFAELWTDFSIYYSNYWGNRKNYTVEWWKWCDEFAEWVMNSPDIDEGWAENAYGLVREEENNG